MKLENVEIDSNGKILERRE